MTHHAASSCWECYSSSANTIQVQADESFALLKQNDRHPSLHFKKIGKLWSVRASRDYRALGIDVDDGVLWIWIGAHAEYDRLVNRS